MAVQMRPYFIILNGKEHMVEAAQPAAAIQHLIGDAVSELRPARAAEVAAWYRAGKPVQTAVGKPKAAAVVESTPGIETPPGPNDLVPAQSIIESSVKFDGGDAMHWFEQDKGFTKTARATWDAVVASGRMTLEQFDTLRSTLPAFSSALCFNPAHPEAAIVTDALRVGLGEKSMPVEVIIELIGEAVIRENATEAKMATHD